MWWCKCRRRKHGEGEWCCVDQNRKKLEQLVVAKEKSKLAEKKIASVASETPQTNLATSENKESL